MRFSWRRRTVRRFVCGVGDTVVIEFPGPLSTEEALSVRDAASAALGGGRVLVLTEGMRVAAVLAAGGA